ncbi:MAG: hypothetical protein IK116_04460 [Firmicutes bacterium]|nr:hypothetical protein [Bacillota bacterium]
MIGRQVIVTEQAFTLEELYAFMEEHWDRAAYGDFVLGRPTPASIERYILLPATPRFLVLVFPRAKGSLFHKQNKVILTTADTPAGAREGFYNSLPTRSILAGARKISSSFSMEKERKGPAEDVLQEYTAYMRQLLQQAGLTR